MADTTKRPTTVSRRDVLRGAAALTGTAVGAQLLGAPAIVSAQPVTLRYLGTAVNQSKEIAQKVKADLGIVIEYVPVTTDDVSKRIITQPASFDIADAEYFQLRKLIPSGNLIGMDATRIKYADKITPVFTRGEIAGKKIGDQGTAPKKVFYLEGKSSTKFSATPTQWITLIPTVYNADTLGIRPDLIKRPIGSWSELLNAEFKGKSSILNIPSIGIMDAAMVVESMGVHKYQDKGNMTRAEIDLTTKALIEAKKAGQFRAFWKDFNESVNLMASGEVVIQSMWSPAVTKVRQSGIACTYQPLKEGYRAWAAGLGMPSHVEGKMLDVCYEFINWYLSGWVGAFLNRQGYYNAVAATAKANMTPDEWDFWMEGKPAKGEILGPTGEKIEKAGTVRDGGSLWDLMGRVSVWNTVMDEDRYMVRKWNEFIAA